METYLIWSLTFLLTLIGLAGVVIPLLPGTTLIFVAMIVHKLLLPGDVSWMVIGWIAGFWLLSVIVDFGGVLLGTRLFGGGKWGMVGAGGGALIGMFFSFPMLLLGTVLGAVQPRLPPRRRRRRGRLPYLNGRTPFLRLRDDRAVPPRRLAKPASVLIRP